jgi:putative ABC transport system ATP-binding protein
MSNSLFIPNSAPASGLGPPRHSNAVLSLQQIEKTYVLGKERDGKSIEFQALKGVSFEVYAGEMVALMGPSGSGKTTLMQIIGLLDRASHGQYLLSGRDVTTLSENERAEHRNELIGFVFQAFHILARLNLVENVEVPMVYAGIPARERRERAMTMLGKVGLADKWRNLPSQISGGQKQRVAVARALALAPKLLLADEPTGNLDSRTSEEILALFQELNDEGTTVVIVTHEPDVGEHCSRIVRLRDGLLERDEHNPSPRRAQKSPLSSVLSQ